MNHSTDQVPVRQSPHHRSHFLKSLNFPIDNTQMKPENPNCKSKSINTNWIFRIGPALSLHLWHWDYLSEVLGFNIYACMVVANAVIIKMRWGYTITCNLAIALYIGLLRTLLAPGLETILFIDLIFGKYQFWAPQEMGQEACNVGF